MLDVLLQIYAITFYWIGRSKCPIVVKIFSLDHLLVRGAYFF